MRHLCAVLMACLISAGLFVTMARLINPEQATLPSLAAAITVDISAVNTVVEPPAKPAEQMPEPQIAPLATPQSPVIKPTNINIELPSNELSWQDSAINIEQKYWSQPIMAAATSGGDYIGEADTGVKEIVPSSTQRPNIPKLAYENKTSGWVLLAFTVKPSGTVSDIRVMDAYPRGLFEANAIQAVKSWLYEPFSGQARYISQKIDFDWPLYSYNMDRP